MATAVNENALQYEAAPQAVVGQDVTHIGVWTAQNGGAFLGGDPITTDPEPLALGDQYEIEAGQIVITQPPGDFNEAMARRALAGMVSGGLWISVHSGPSGANGTANLIALARVNIAQADWTIA